MLKTVVSDRPIVNVTLLGRRNVWRWQIEFGPIISSFQVCLQPSLWAVVVLEDKHRLC